jgi:tRNA threonylcarbamoyladenosine biosynthesis protein TsaE
MVVILSKKLEDTRNTARKVLDYAVKCADGNSATVIGLYGDLGAGKTAFVKEIASVVGIKENVLSPTFVILKRYDIKNRTKQYSEVFKNLIHIDAYRLEGSNNLEQLNWNEISKNSENIIFIEWPDNIKEVLPNNIIKVYFKFIDEDTREIKYNFNKN